MAKKCPCLELLEETEYNAAEKALRRPSIQAMGWVSLATFSQVYSENGDLQFSQQSLCKVRDKKAWFMKEILKRNNVLFVGTTGKVPFSNLRNWSSHSSRV